MSVGQAAPRNRSKNKNPQKIDELYDILGTITRSIVSANLHFPRRFVLHGSQNNAYYFDVNHFRFLLTRFSLPFPFLPFHWQEIRDRDYFCDTMSFNTCHKTRCYTL